jgi:signal transduction histidine kinase
MSALFQLATAGWPLCLMVAVVIAGDRVREARRRRGLNRALHELRRPLQALVLASGPVDGPGPHVLRVALAALGDLDREINGGRRPLARRPIACRALVEPAVERWRGPAAAARRSLVLNWRAGSAVVMADPDRIAQALDNLIDNSLRHGGLRTCVEASLSSIGVRIVVADGGPVRFGHTRGNDPRHGHGLEIVAAIASEHGGRFEMRRGPAGTAAILELPRAPRGQPLARDSAPAGAPTPADAEAPRARLAA